MRKLAAFTVSFALGICLAQYLLPEGLLLPVAAVFFAAACLALLLPGLWRKRVLLVGTGLALALGWNWLYSYAVRAPLAALSGSEGTASMTLLEYAVPTDYGAKVTVKLEGVPLGKVVCYGGADLLDLEPGQTVAAQVKFQDSARLREDTITNFTAQGVFLLAYQRGDEAVYGEGSAGSPRWWPAHAARAMQNRVTALFDGDEAAFLSAILTGDTSGLSEEARSDLSEAGLSHILAVSGLHCGFLMTLILLLTGRHRHRLAAALALPVLMFYTLLTGASPSVVRACIMVVFVLAAPLFQRDSDPPTTLSAALFLILLANPFAAASISLQLSFGAMAGLLWLTPKLQDLLLGERPSGKVCRLLVSSLSATVGAMAFTVPLCAVYFGSLVLISPVSNLLCLTASSLVFTLGLGAVLASFLWVPLGTVIGFVPALLTRYILWISGVLASVPHHALYFTNPYLKYWLVFLYVLFAAAFFLRPKARRKYAVAGVLAAVSLAVTVRLGAPHYTRGGLDAYVLDVGQGESVLLTSGGKFALVDCGSRNSWYDAGGIAADHLATMGCGTLDYLILTHYDYDHISGVAELLARARVDTLLLPDVSDDAGARFRVELAARNHGVDIQYVEAETVYILWESSLTIYPAGGRGGRQRTGAGRPVHLWRLRPADYRGPKHGGGAAADRRPRSARHRGPGSRPPRLQILYLEGVAGGPDAGDGHHQRGGQQLRPPHGGRPPPPGAGRRGDLPDGQAGYRPSICELRRHHGIREKDIQGQRGLSETEKRPGRGNGGERLHLLRGGDVSPGVLSQRAAEEAGPRRV